MAIYNCLMPADNQLMTIDNHHKPSAGFLEKFEKSQQDKPES